MAKQKKIDEEGNIKLLGKQAKQKRTVSLQKAFRDRAKVDLFFCVQFFPSVVSLFSTLLHFFQNIFFLFFRFSCDGYERRDLLLKHTDGKCVNFSFFFFHFWILEKVLVLLYPGWLQFYFFQCFFPPLFFFVDRPFFATHSIYFFILKKKDRRKWKFWDLQLGCGWQFDLYWIKWWENSHFQQMYAGESIS